MREKRRLALAQRQLLLAQIAKREALAAMADAVDEETKSAKLAARSAELVREYDRQPVQAEGADLRERAAFVRSLQTVEKQASDAHDDAREQTVWQSRTLAAAQSRADRMEERLDAAKSALGQALVKRDPELAARLARKLQTASGEAVAPANGANLRSEQ